MQRKLALQLMDYMSVRPYPLDMSGWIRPGIGRMVERMLGDISGLRVDIDDALPERDGVVERFVPPAPCPTRATPYALAHLPGRIRRLTRLAGPTTRGSSGSRRGCPSSPPRPADLGWTELLRGRVAARSRWRT